MGDHILMKKLLLISLVPLLPLALSAVTLANSHETIAQQIAEIKPARIGVSNRAVNSVRSPFIYMKTITKHGKKVTVVQEKKRIKFKPMKLESAINKNVKINGKWYKEGDRIREYTIIKVSDDGVAYLKSRKKELKLYLNQKNDKIKFNVN